MSVPAGPWSKPWLDAGLVCCMESSFHGCFWPELFAVPGGLPSLTFSSSIPSTRSLGPCSFLQRSCSVLVLFRHDQDLSCPLAPSLHRTKAMALVSTQCGQLHLAAGGMGVSKLGSHFSDRSLDKQPNHVYILKPIFIF